MVHNVVTARGVGQKNVVQPMRCTAKTEGVGIIGFHFRLLL